MPSYKQLSPDDTINIKGGEKFVILRKEDLLPDGRLRPQGPDETTDDWEAYVNRRIEDVLNDAKITDAEAERKLKQMFALPDAFKGFKSSSPQIQGYMAKVQVIIQKAMAKSAEWREKVREQQNIETFYQAINAIKLVLQPNTATRLHKMLEGRVMREGSHKSLELIYENTFVVQHDWLAVLGDTNPELHEWVLPYDSCLFEFMVGGHACITHVSETEAGKKFHHFIQLDPLQWWNPLRELPITKFLEQQIAACCVVLEAEVATHEVVRQPTALQAKREKKGKPRMLDYHVIDLSKKKPKISNPLDTQTPEEQKGRKRLHFCRGHWRQYPTHRTRIPWCLKGNAELGFINKMYKL